MNKFDQKVYVDGDGTKVVAVGQTRGGKDEWITPATIWELDDATGQYMPPGESANPRRPRVEAVLTGITEDTPLEVKAKALELLLTTLVEKDFATEETLAAIRSLLVEIEKKDSPTETTLNEVLTALRQALSLMSVNHYPEHRLLSTDDKPSASEEGKGAVIFEIDTGVVYMSDGASWKPLA